MQCGHMWNHICDVINGLNVCLNATDPSDFIFRSTIAKDKDNLHRTLFSFAVWKTRCTALASPNTQGLQFAIHSLFDKLLKSIEKQKTKANRDQSAEKSAFMSGLDSIPPEDLSIYTDGSSFGNPGPSGAGFVVLPNSACPEHHYSTGNLKKGFWAPDLFQQSGNPLQMFCEFICKP